MSRSLIGTVLFATLTVLFLLRKKEQAKKAAERQAQLESGGYVPISLDDADPDGVTGLADTAIRWYHRMSLAVALFLIAVVAFLAVVEPLVKWILSGTLALMALIVMISNLKREGNRE